MDFPKMKTTVIKYSDTLAAFDQEMVRCFLILGTERALLLDTGAAPCDLPALIREITPLPVIAANTHGDGDHTANNSLFPAVYIHPDDIPVMEQFGQKFDYEILPLSDGQIFDLGGRKLEVLHVPGHTPGSCCFLDLTNRMLFAGDTVQRDSVFLFGSHRVTEKYPAALEKLQARADAYDSVWPCHGPCPVDPDTVPALLRCYTAAAAGELTPQASDRQFHGDSQPQLYALDGCSVLL